MTIPATGRLGKLLKQLRLEAGVSLYELAKRTRINRSTLMRIEDGQRTNLAKLNEIARGLGVEPEIFYDALWQSSDQPLPSPRVYFRTKYRLTRDQIAEIERSIEQITQKPTKDAPKSERRSP